MNRIDRLFAITVLLRGSARLRAADLAESFGVSRRTIYRDIAALNEGGIPVVSLPGEGYELMPGYTLPPLAFTPDEAAALVLGARLLAAQAGGQLPADAETALVKLAGVLPDVVREQVERLSATIGFLPSLPRFDPDEPRLRLLRQAIHERRLLRLRYHSRNRDELTERRVEPLRLEYGDGAWYLSAYCLLRKGLRAFRLDRIEDAELLEQRFAPRSSAPASPPPAVEVRVRFAPSVLRWVRERQHYGFREETPLPDGRGAVMRYDVAATDEIVHWLRGWGAAAEVLAPVSLRRALREEARRLVEMLT